MLQYTYSAIHMCLFFYFLFFNSLDTTTSLPETTKTTHVKIVTRNYSTTASTDEKKPETLTYNFYFIYDEIFIMPILAGVLIPIILFSMLCVISRKGKTVDFGFFLFYLNRILKDNFAKNMIIGITMNWKPINLKMLLGTETFSHLKSAQLSKCW